MLLRVGALEADDLLLELCDDLTVALLLLLLLVALCERTAPLLRDEELCDLTDALLLLLLLAGACDLTVALFEERL